MPYDNTNGDLSQLEVDAFACYFSLVARRHSIPWSINDLSKFELEMAPILEATQCAVTP
jgi:hypothetical protein